MAPDQKPTEAEERNMQRQCGADEGRPGHEGSLFPDKQRGIGPKEMQRWGEVIRQRRRDLGLTLKQLSELTGISFGYLAKLERGDPDAKNPTRMVIDVLREALNISAPGGERLSRAALASWRSRGAQTGSAFIDGVQEPQARPLPDGHKLQQRWQVAEALLLICSRLSAAQLAAGLGCGLFEVEEVICALREHLVGHGIVVQEMNGEYQLASDAALGPALQPALIAIGLAPHRQGQLTQAQREGLGLGIMDQPITRAAIERYRGVDSEKPLHALIEAELVVALPATTPTGARQYVPTLRVLEESGYSSLEDLHQAISNGVPAPVYQPAIEDRNVI